MPNIQPRMAIVPSSAGAAHMSVRKYSAAIAAVCGSASITHDIRAPSECRSSHSSRPIATPRATACEKRRRSSGTFLDPKAWAVRPEVPMRRKPKSQKTGLTIMAPTAMAPR